MTLTSKWLDRLWQLVVFWSIVTVTLLWMGKIEPQQFGTMGLACITAWTAIEGIKTWKGTAE